MPPISRLSPPNIICADRVLGVALDGHGYGDDGGAWGGELMALDGARWRRLGHLLPLALPGGDRAAREPWRMGVAALAALGRGAKRRDVFPGSHSPDRLAAVLAAHIQTPTTISMGRLFDAAAALLGVCTRQSYEGQAAMELEALVRDPKRPARRLSYHRRYARLQASPRRPA